MLKHWRPASSGLLALAILSPCLSMAAPAATQKPAAVSVEVWTEPNGTMQYRYDGKKVDAKEFDRLCDDGIKKKAKFRLEQHFPAGDQVKAILLEARCTGAYHIGFTGIDQYPVPPAAAHRHATPPRKAASPR